MSSANPPPKSLWLGAAGYLAMLSLGIALFFLIRQTGLGLSAPQSSAETRMIGTVAAGQVDLVLHVLVTLAAVLGLGFLLGRICRSIGQPPVIGEVIAGILLGPSLVGAISPTAMHLLVPSIEQDPKQQVSSALKAISQLGVILYMFLVGLELNAARLKNQAKSAIAISHASIVVPFVLGAALALWLYPTLSHSAVPFTSFALFLGVAMAITAFPVLARILADSKLDRTDLGVVALGCAAADDVTAWCLLALVVGVAQAQVGEALLVGAAAGLFILGMFFVARPLLKKLTDRLDASPGPLPPYAVSGTFFLVLACAFGTEWIGVHAVFGAFLLGAVIPHESRIAKEFTAKLHDPVTVLLLPAFFASSGMRTELGLLSGWENWLFVGVIIAVATVGKFGGTLVAARVTGQTWKDSAALGALMNTRGLMGLIVLDIGLEMGVISKTLFAMMVLMALATTLATSPVLRALKLSKSNPV